MTAPNAHAYTSVPRYNTDAAKLYALASRLTGYAPDPGEETPDRIALDYYRLADQLQQMADDARQFARLYATN